jgi:hypothetical protein
MRAVKPNEVASAKELADEIGVSATRIKAVASEYEIEPWLKNRGITLYLKSDFNQYKKDYASSPQHHSNN